MIIDLQTTTPTIRPIKSFVRRQGRLTPGQRHALNTLATQYLLTIETGIQDWSAVFGRATNTVLEIGFGMGDALLNMAQAAPENNFIGIDIYPPGIGRLLAKLNTQNLTNVRLYCADAAEVLPQCIADGSLSAVNIFFPDPWPKQRHHKRRLIQVPFLQLLVTKLKPGGRLHLATDWEHYAQHMLHAASAIDDLIQVVSNRGDRPLTKYEQRGQRLGHGIWDLVFIKPGSAGGPPAKVST